MNLEIIKRIKSWAIFLMALIFLFNLILKLPFLDTLVTVIITGLYLYSLLQVKKTSRIISWGLLAVSAAILIFYRSPFAVWLEAVYTNVYLVVLFSLVPLLAIPLKAPKYTEALNSFFLCYANSNERFYIILKTVTYFLASMLNVAVIPLIYHISLNRKPHNKFVAAMAIIRGFSASMLWAPSYAACALVMSLTGARWSQFVGVAFSVGVVLVLVGWIQICFIYGRAGETEIPHDIKPDNRSLLELAFLQILLIILLLLGNHYLHYSVVTLVSMAALFFPLFWLLLIKEKKLILPELKGYFSITLPKLNNEIALFIGAGILAAAVASNPIGDLIGQLFHQLIGSNHWLITPVIIIANFILSILGVHPIITVTLLGSTLDPSLYGASAAFMAVVYLSCWTLGILVSPSSANNIAMAGLTDKEPTDMIRWNAVYSLIATLIVGLALMAVYALGWL